MCANHITVSLSSGKRLVTLALALYLPAIFLPWVVEVGMYEDWSWRNTGSVMFWSFMAVNNGNRLLFGEFWLNEPLLAFLPHRPVWNGLYNGWALIFVFQMLTVAYFMMYLLRGRVSETLREKHPTWLIILPLTTILLAIYAMFIQEEMTYQDIVFYHYVYPHIGFWLATSSLIVLLVAIKTASGQSQLKNVPKNLKRSLKRTWFAVAIIFIAAFFVIEELQFQTCVTKLMYVEDSKDFQKIHENPELWENHFSKITLIASFFRARVFYNNPEYAFCELEVPLISYKMLAAFLNSVGYEACEPLFMHPLSLHQICLLYDIARGQRIWTCT